jgi:hypothetical protein
MTDQFPTALPKTFPTRQAAAIPVQTVDQDPSPQA